MQDIDFVILWVDGNDPEWQAEVKKYKADTTFKYRKEEYRDWNLLKYLFRGIEKYTPWVRKIHFVTNGQLPDWLDISNPKIHHVKHEDIMPKEILPVFNSSLIEVNINKIEGLSETFVYFNDDTFITAPIKKEFFFRDGKPCDMLALQPVVANADNPSMTHIFMNNSLVLAKHFKKRENVKKQPGKYFKVGYPPLYFCYNFLELAFPRFTGFYTAHTASPLLKSVMDEVWEAEEATLKNMYSSRFRSDVDVSQYLFREWAKLSGKFYPVNIHKGFRYAETNYNINKICDCVRKQKQKIFCINDSIIESDFETSSKMIVDAFESILPEKSTFEK